jgi:hypothetical protein
MNEQTDVAAVLSHTFAASTIFAPPVLFRGRPFHFGLKK